MLKTKSHKSESVYRCHCWFWNLDIILPIFSFQRSKLFISQFLIWHKTMLNPKKFWT